MKLPDAAPPPGQTLPAPAAAAPSLLAQPGSSTGVQAATAALAAASSCCLLTCPPAAPAAAAAVRYCACSQALRLMLLLKSHRALLSRFSKPSRALSRAATAAAAGAGAAADTGAAAPAQAAGAAGVEHSSSSNRHCHRQCIQHPYKKLPKDSVIAGVLACTGPAHKSCLHAGPTPTHACNSSFPRWLTHDTQLTTAVCTQSKSTLHHTHRQHCW